MFNRSKTIPDPDTPPMAHSPGAAKSSTIQDRRIPRRHLAAKHPVSVKKGSFSLHGRKREDRLILGSKILEKNGTVVDLNVVIDGHGGHQTADFLERELPLTVSRLCMERSASLETDFTPKAEWSALLNDAFSQCSDAWDRCASTHQEKKAGAVVTMLLVCGIHCFVAHVGDGKVVSSGSGESYTEITKDHRADDPSERARILACGGCVVNDRVRGVLAPSRAFGDILVRTDGQGEVNNSIIRPTPDLIAFDVARPGFVVVGTDGLFDVISSGVVHTAISIFLASNSDPNAAARYLAEHASKRTDDDISIIVIMWK
jgi:serine/threonine protein phosphatase PrpC